jgi:aryl-alcohol dehydrogenase-like predicted oxidoreductase
MKVIPGTSLAVYPLCLGGNVFGWSADVTQSFAVLDAFHDMGGSFIDTADVYTEWVAGNSGGESESILGQWMESRSNRSSMVIATKVAKLSRRRGLSAHTIVAACDESLARLRTDYIDLYYAHEDDPLTPMEETLRAFDSLVRSGKVRYIACSNFTPERMEQAIKMSKELGLAAYVAAQDLYNLLDQQQYETGLRDVIKRNELSILPYYALAKGFLSGKYRPGQEINSVRAAGTQVYHNERGWRVLSKLDEIAKRHQTSLSAVSLAWLRAQPTVSVPIASARTIEQLTEIMPLIELGVEDQALLAEK